MTYETRIQVRPCDHDALGHINHAVHLSYCEVARAEWLTCVFGACALREFVVARVAIDYHSPLAREETEVFVRVRLSRIGRSSLTVGHDLVSASECLLATAEVVLVAYDPESCGPRRLTEDELAELGRGPHLAADTLTGHHPRPHGGTNQ